MFTGLVEALGTLTRRTPDGAGGHHLQDLDGIKVLRDGRIKFFMEYQGDWNAVTHADEEDPPVWIEGCWYEEGDHYEKGEDRRYYVDQPGLATPRRESPRAVVTPGGRVFGDAMAEEVERHVPVALTRRSTRPAR